LAAELFGSSATSFYRFFEPPAQSAYERNIIFSGYDPVTSYYFQNSEPLAESSPKERNEEDPNRTEGNHLLGVASYEVGVNIFDGMTIGYFDRLEITFHTNADLLSVYYNIFQSDDPYTYKVNGSAALYRAEGLFAQKSFHSGNHTLFIQSRLLYGTEYMDLGVNGWLDTDNPTDTAYYYLDATHHYYKKNLINGDEDLRPHYGKGFAHDLGYRYKNHFIEIEMGAKNLFGTITWQNIPYYVESATSFITKTSSEGWLYTFRGTREAMTTIDNGFIYELPRHYYVYGAYALEKVRLDALWYKVDEIESYALSLSWREWGISYDFPHHNLEFIYAIDDVRFGLSSSITSIKDAQSVSAFYTLIWGP